MSVGLAVSLLIVKGVNPCSNMGGIILGRNIHVHPACLSRGGRGHAPREIFFKCCNLVRFGVYLDQVLSFKNSKIIIFYRKGKYFRYTLASYGVILLKICLEAFHD